jgi:nicotinamide mononucleotide transporter
MVDAFLHAHSNAICLPIPDAPPVMTTVDDAILPILGNLEFPLDICSMQNHQWLELIAIASGIISVWFSKKENTWVFPTGLLNTIIYVYLSFQSDLFGEALVNFYYTIMSLYGWYNWLRKDRNNIKIVKVKFSSRREWTEQVLFFSVVFFALFASLIYIKGEFAPGAIPWADALASATAFTAMWLMARKKVESWIWWIMTNVASIPLYFVKGLQYTSGYYAILLVLAVAGWSDWRKRAKLNEQ